MHFLNHAAPPMTEGVMSPARCSISAYRGCRQAESEVDRVFTVCGSGSGQVENWCDVCDSSTLDNQLL